MKKNKRKQFVHKIEALLLTLSITTTGSICVYKYVRDPKVEKITTKGYIYTMGTSKYDEIYLNNDIRDPEYQEVLNSIKGNKNINRKKAEVLYYAILQNDSLTQKEKKELSNYIQYFIDNKYIDYEHVFNKLLKFTITKDNPALLDQGIGASYNEGNSITFAGPEERKYLLTHEMLHCIESEKLPYEKYSWFIEGYDCTVNYEYFDNEFDGHNMKTNFIRCLCELVDPDVLFKVSAIGDINPLVCALTEKGVDTEKIQNLFNLCEEYCLVEASGNGDLKAIGAEIVICFADMYNIIYDNPDYVSDAFVHSLLKIKVEVDDIYNYYYFNSDKTKKNKKKQYNRTQDELFVIYEESTMICR